MIAEKYSCPCCKLVLAKEDLRRSWEGGFLLPSGLLLLNGATLTAVPNQAPRLKCRCSQTVVLLKGAI